MCPHVDKHNNTTTTLPAVQLYLKPQQKSVEANLRSRFIRKRRRNYVGFDCKRMRVRTELRAFDSDSSDAETSSDFSVETTQSVEILSDADNRQLAAYNQISSPQVVHPPLPSIDDVSTINADMDDASVSSADGSSSNELEPASDANFRLCINAITAKHGTSDAEARDWVKLVKIVSFRDDLPSFKTIKKQFHINKLALSAVVKKNGDGEFIKLNFVEELQTLLKDNINLFYSYDSSREKHSDLQLPSAFNFATKTIDVFLIMNSDGVRLVKSSSKSLWPVWFAIALFPPVKRSLFENIVLAALWFGNNKPSWDEMFQVNFSLIRKYKNEKYIWHFFQVIKNDLQTDFSVKFQSHVFIVRYRVVLLVSDMPATASMLTMHHHLATYGCTLCPVETKRQDRIRYYPFKRFKLRTAEIHNECLRTLERQRLKSFKGVKGKS